MQRNTDILTIGLGLPLVVASWLTGIGDAIGGVVALALIFGGYALVRLGERLLLRRKAAP